MKLYKFMIHLSKKHLNLTVSLRVINEILAKVYVSNIVEAYRNGSARVL